jgi:hypothetical protein
MNQPFDLNNIHVEHQHEPEDSFFERSATFSPHADTKLKTYIETTGTTVFVQMGAFLIGAPGAFNPRQVSAGDLVTFNGEGELLLEFLQPTNFLTEADLLFDSAD